MAHGHRESNQHRCDQSNYEAGALQHQTERLVESLVPDLPRPYRDIVLAHDADPLQFLFEKLGEDMDSLSQETRSQAITAYIKADSTVGGYLASEFYARNAHAAWSDAHGTDQTFTHRALSALAEVYLAIVERRTYKHKPGGDPRPYIRKAVKYPIRPDRERDQANRRAQHETYLTYEDWESFGEDDDEFSSSRSDTASAEEQLLRNIEVEEAEAIFASLPASQKERRYLRARWDGDDFKQIAQDMGVRPGAARQAVSHFNERTLRIREGCLFQALHRHALNEKPIDLSDHQKWVLPAVNLSLSQACEDAASLLPSEHVTETFWGQSRITGRSLVFPLTSGIKQRSGRLFISYVSLDALELLFEDDVLIETNSAAASAAVRSFLDSLSPDPEKEFPHDDYGTDLLEGLNWHLPDAPSTGLANLDAIIKHVRQRCPFEGTFRIHTLLKLAFPRVPSERRYYLPPTLLPGDIEDFSLIDIYQHYGIITDPTQGPYSLGSARAIDKWRRWSKAEERFRGLQDYYYNGGYGDDDW